MSSGLALPIRGSLCLKPVQTADAGSGRASRFGGTLRSSNHANPPPAVTDVDDPSEGSFPWAGGVGGDAGIKVWGHPDPKGKGK